MKRSVFFVSIVSVLAAAAATGSIGAVTVRTQKAADTYQSQCAKCHGHDGKGIESLPGMPNFTDASWQAKHTDKELSDSISGGKGIMPPYKDKLSGGEITALVKYVRAFAGGAKGKKK